ncbi:MAG TPA: tetratricopeptide repeat protein [Bacteroidota bacterium]|nr:tetratricopeptide repeat protein [Bacteroidota bacterium]
MIRVGLFVLLAVACLAGCGKPTAEEYFARGRQEAARATLIADSLRSEEAVREAFKPALALLGNVVSEYPHHPLADSALFMIAGIRQSNLHMPVEAIEGYRQYCRDYPGGSQAPTAMFLIGYLYNNELHNTDSAAAAYRRFLAMYPENAMAQSARFELDNLGKSPDEVLTPVEPESPKGGKHGVRTAAAKPPARPGT